MSNANAYKQAIVARLADKDDKKLELNVQNPANSVIPSLDPAKVQLAKDAVGDMLKLVRDRDSSNIAQVLDITQKAVSRVYLPTRQVSDKSLGEILNVPDDRVTRMDIELNLPGENPIKVNIGVGQDQNMQTLARQALYGRLATKGLNNISFEEKDEPLPGSSGASRKVFKITVDKNEIVVPEAVYREFETQREKLRTSIATADREASSASIAGKSFYAAQKRYASILLNGGDLSELGRLERKSSDLRFKFYVEQLSAENEKLSAENRLSSTDIRGLAWDYAVKGRDLPLKGNASGIDFAKAQEHFAANSEAIRKGHIETRWRSTRKDLIAGVFGKGSDSDTVTIRRAPTIISLLGKFRWFNENVLAPRRMDTIEVKRGDLRKFAGYSAKEALFREFLKSSISLPDVSGMKLGDSVSVGRINITIEDKDTLATLKTVVSMVKTYKENQDMWSKSLIPVIRGMDKLIKDLGQEGVNKQPLEVINRVKEYINKSISETKIRQGILEVIEVMEKDTSVTANISEFAQVLQSQLEMASRHLQGYSSQISCGGGKTYGAMMVMNIFFETYKDNPDMLPNMVLVVRENEDQFKVEQLRKLFEGKEITVKGEKRKVSVVNGDAHSRSGKSLVDFLNDPSKILVFSHGRWGHLRNEASAELQQAIYGQRLVLFDEFHLPLGDHLTYIVSLGKELVSRELVTDLEKANTWFEGYIKRQGGKAKIEVKDPSEFQRRNNAGERVILFRTEGAKDWALSDAIIRDLKKEGANPTYIYALLEARLTRDSRFKIVDGKIISRSEQGKLEPDRVFGDPYYVAAIAALNKDVDRSTLYISKSTNQASISEILRHHPLSLVSGFTGTAEGTELMNLIQLGKRVVKITDTALKVDKVKFTDEPVEIVSELRNTKGVALIHYKNRDQMERTRKEFAKDPKIKIIEIDTATDGQTKINIVEYFNKLGIDISSISDAQKPNDIISFIVKNIGEIGKLLEGQDQRLVIFSNERTATGMDFVGPFTEVILDGHNWGLGDTKQAINRLRPYYWGDNEKTQKYGFAGKRIIFANKELFQGTEAVDSKRIKGMELGSLDKNSVGSYLKHIYHLDRRQASQSIIHQEAESLLFVGLLRPLKNWVISAKGTPSHEFLSKKLQEAIAHHNDKDWSDLAFSDNPTKKDLQIEQVARRVATQVIRTMDEIASNEKVSVFIRAEAKKYADDAREVLSGYESLKPEGLRLAISQAMTLQDAVRIFKSPKILDNVLELPGRGAAINRFHPLAAKVIERFNSELLGKDATGQPLTRAQENNFLNSLQEFVISNGIRGAPQLRSTLVGFLASSASPLANVFQALSKKQNDFGLTSPTQLQEFLQFLDTNIFLNSAFNNYSYGEKVELANLVISLHNPSMNYEQLVAAHQAFNTLLADNPSAQKEFEVAPALVSPPLGNGGLGAQEKFNIISELSSKVQDKKPVSLSDDSAKRAKELESLLWALSCDRGSDEYKKAMMVLQRLSQRDINSLWAQRNGTEFSVLTPQLEAAFRAAGRFTTNAAYLSMAFMSAPWQFVGRNVRTYTAASSFQFLLAQLGRAEEVKDVTWRQLWDIGMLESSNPLIWWMRLKEKNEMALFDPAKQFALSHRVQVKAGEVTKMPKQTQAERDAKVDEIFGRVGISLPHDATQLKAQRDGLDFTLLRMTRDYSWVQFDRANKFGHRFEAAGVSPNTKVSRKERFELVKAYQMMGFEEKEKYLTQLLSEAGPEQQIQIYKELDEIDKAKKAIEELKFPRLGLGSRKLLSAEMLTLLTALPKERLRLAGKYNGQIYDDLDDFADVLEVLGGVSLDRPGNRLPPKAIGEELKVVGAALAKLYEKHAKPQDGASAGPAPTFAMVEALQQGKDTQIDVDKRSVQIVVDNGINSLGKYETTTTGTTLTREMIKVNLKRIRRLSQQLSQLLMQQEVLRQKWGAVAPALSQEDLAQQIEKVLILATIRHEARHAQDLSDGKSEKEKEIQAYLEVLHNGTQPEKFIETLLLFSSSTEHLMVSDVANSQAVSFIRGELMKPANADEPAAVSRDIFGVLLVDLNPRVRLECIQAAGQKTINRFNTLLGFIEPDVNLALVQERVAKVDDAQKAFNAIFDRNQSIFLREIATVSTHRVQEWLRDDFAPAALKRIPVTKLDEVQKNWNSLSGANQSLANISEDAKSLIKGTIGKLLKEDEELLGKARQNIGQLIKQLPSAPVAPIAAAQAAPAASGVTSSRPSAEPTAGDQMVSLSFEGKSLQVPLAALVRADSVNPLETHFSDGTRALLRMEGNRLFIAVDTVRVVIHQLAGGGTREEEVVEPGWVEVPYTLSHQPLSPSISAETPAKVEAAAIPPTPVAPTPALVIPAPSLAVPTPTQTPDIVRLYLETLQNTLAQDIDVTRALPYGLRQDLLEKWSKATLESIKEELAREAEIAVRPFKITSDGKSESINVLALGGIREISLILEMINKGFLPPNADYDQINSIIEVTQDEPEVHRLFTPEQWLDWRIKELDSALQAPDISAEKRQLYSAEKEYYEQMKAKVAPIAAGLGELRKAVQEKEKLRDEAVAAIKKFINKALAAAGYEEDEIRQITESFFSALLKEGKDLKKVIAALPLAKPEDGEKLQNLLDLLAPLFTEQRLNYMDNFIQTQEAINAHMPEFQQKKEEYDKLAGEIIQTAANPLSQPLISNNARLNMFKELFGVTDGSIYTPEGRQAYLKKFQLGPQNREQNQLLKEMTPENFLIAMLSAAERFFPISSQTETWIIGGKQFTDFDKLVAKLSQELLERKYHQEEAAGLTSEAALNIYERLKMVTTNLSLEEIKAQCQELRQEAEEAEHKNDLSPVELSILHNLIAAKEAELVLDKEVHTELAGLQTTWLNLTKPQIENLKEELAAKKAALEKKVRSNIIVTTQAKEELIGDIRTTFASVFAKLERSALQSMVSRLSELKAKEEELKAKLMRNEKFTHEEEALSEELKQLLNDLSNLSPEAAAELPEEYYRKWEYSRAKERPSIEEAGELHTALLLRGKLESAKVVEVRLANTFINTEGLERDELKRAQEHNSKVQTTLKSLESARKKIEEQQKAEASIQQSAPANFTPLSRATEGKQKTLIPAFSPYSLTPQQVLDGLKDRLSSDQLRSLKGNIARIQRYFEVIHPRAPNLTLNPKELQVEMAENVPNFAQFKDNTIVLDIELLKLKPEQFLPTLTFIISHEGLHHPQLLGNNEVNVQSQDAVRFGKWSAKHKELVKQGLLALGVDGNSDYMQKLQEMSNKLTQEPVEPVSPKETNNRNSDNPLPPLNNSSANNVGTLVNTQSSSVTNHDKLPIAAVKLVSCTGGKVGVLGGPAKITPAFGTQIISQAGPISGPAGSAQGQVGAKENSGQEKEFGALVGGYSQNGKRSVGSTNAVLSGSAGAQSVSTAEVSKEQGAQSASDNIKVKSTGELQAGAVVGGRSKADEALQLSQALPIDPEKERPSIARNHNNGTGNSDVVGNGKLPGNSVGETQTSLSNTVVLPQNLTQHPGALRVASKVYGFESFVVSTDSSMFILFVKTLAQYRNQSPSDIMKSLRGETAMVVGAYDETFARYLVDNIPDINVIMVDPLLGENQLNLNRVQMLSMRVQDIPENIGKADIIFSTGTFTADDFGMPIQDFESALAVMKRHLNPDGEMWIVTNWPTNPDWEVALRNAGLKYSLLLDATGFYLITLPVSAQQPIKQQPLRAGNPGPQVPQPNSNANSAGGAGARGVAASSDLGITGVGAVIRGLSGRNDIAAGVNTASHLRSINAVPRAQSPGIVLATASAQMQVVVNEQKGKEVIAGSDSPAVRTESETGAKTAEVACIEVLNSGERIGAIIAGSGNNSRVIGGSASVAAKVKNLAERPAENYVFTSHNSGSSVVPSSSIPQSPKKSTSTPASVSQDNTGKDRVTSSIIPTPIPHVSLSPAGAVGATQGSQIQEVTGDGYASRAPPQPSHTSDGSSLGAVNNTSAHGQSPIKRIVYALLTAAILFILSGDVKNPTQHLTSPHSYELKDSDLRIIKEKGELIFRITRRYLYDITTGYTFGEITDGSGRVYTLLEIAELAFRNPELRSWLSQKGWKYGPRITQTEFPFFYSPEHNSGNPVKDGILNTLEEIDTWRKQQKAREAYKKREEAQKIVNGLLEKVPGAFCPEFNIDETEESKPSPQNKLPINSNTNSSIRNCDVSQSASSGILLFVIRAILNFVKRYTFVALLISVFGSGCSTLNKQSSLSAKEKAEIAEYVNNIKYTTTAELNMSEVIEFYKKYYNIDVSNVKVGLINRYFMEDISIAAGAEIGAFFVKEPKIANSREALIYKEITKDSDARIFVTEGTKREAMGLFLIHEIWHMIQLERGDSLQITRNVHEYWKNSCEFGKDGAWKIQVRAAKDVYGIRTFEEFIGLISGSDENIHQGFIDMLRKVWNDVPDSGNDNPLDRKVAPGNDSGEGANSPAIMKNRPLIKGLKELGAVIANRGALVATIMESALGSRAPPLSTESTSSALKSTGLKNNITLRDKVALFNGNNNSAVTNMSGARTQDTVFVVKGSALAGLSSEALTHARASFTTISLGRDTVTVDVAVNGDLIQPLGFAANVGDGAAAGSLSSEALTLPAGSIPTKREGGVFPWLNLIMGSLGLTTRLSSPRTEVFSRLLGTTATPTSGYSLSTKTQAMSTPVMAGQTAGRNFQNTKRGPSVTWLQKLGISLSTESTALVVKEEAALAAASGFINKNGDVIQPQPTVAGFAANVGDGAAAGSLSSEALTLPAGSIPTKNNSDPISFKLRIFSGLTSLWLLVTPAFAQGPAMAQAVTQKPAAQQVATQQVVRPQIAPFAPVAPQITAPGVAQNSAIVQKQVIAPNTGRLYRKTTVQDATESEARNWIIFNTFSVDKKDIGKLIGWSLVSLAGLGFVVYKALRGRATSKDSLLNLIACFITGVGVYQAAHLVGIKATPHFSAPLPLLTAKPVSANTISFNLDASATFITNTIRVAVEYASFPQGSFNNFGFVNAPRINFTHTKLAPDTTNYYRAVIYYPDGRRQYSQPLVVASKKLPRYRAPYGPYEEVTLRFLLEDIPNNIGMPDKFKKYVTMKDHIARRPEVVKQEIETKGNRRNPNQGENVYLKNNIHRVLVTAFLSGVDPYLALAQYIQEGRRDMGIDLSTGASDGRLDEGFWRTKIQPAYSNMYGRDLKFDAAKWFSWVDDPQVFPLVYRLAVDDKWQVYPLELNATNRRLNPHAAPMLPFMQGNPYAWQRARTIQLWQGGGNLTGDMKFYYGYSVMAICEMLQNKHNNLTVHELVWRAYKHAQALRGGAANIEAVVPYKTNTNMWNIPDSEQRILPPHSEFIKRSEIRLIYKGGVDPERAKRMPKKDLRIPPAAPSPATGMVVPKNIAQPSVFIQQAPKASYTDQHPLVNISPVLPILVGVFNAGRGRFKVGAVVRTEGRSLNNFDPVSSPAVTALVSNMVSGLENHKYLDLRWSRTIIEKYPWITRNQKVLKVIKEAINSLPNQLIERMDLHRMGLSGGRILLWIDAKNSFLGIANTGTASLRIYLFGHIFRLGRYVIYVNQKKLFTTILHNILHIFSVAVDKEGRRIISQEQLLQLWNWNIFVPLDSKIDFADIQRAIKDLDLNVERRLGLWVKGYETKKHLLAFVSYVENPILDILRSKRLLKLGERERGENVFNYYVEINDMRIQVKFTTDPTKADPYELFAYVGTAILTNNQKALARYRRDYPQAVQYISRLLMPGNQGGAVSAVSAGGSVQNDLKKQGEMLLDHKAGAVVRNEGRSFPFKGIFSALAVIFGFVSNTLAQAGNILAQPTTPTLASPSILTELAQLLSMLPSWFLAATAVFLIVAVSLMVLRNIYLNKILHCQTHFADWESLNNKLERATKADASGKVLFERLDETQRKIAQLLRELKDAIELNAPEKDRLIQLLDDAYRLFHSFADFPAEFTPDLATQRQIIKDFDIDSLIDGLNDEFCSEIVTTLKRYLREMDEIWTSMDDENNIISNMLPERKKRALDYIVKTYWYFCGQASGRLTPKEKIRLIYDLTRKEFLQKDRISQEPFIKRDELKEVLSRILPLTVFNDIAERRLNEIIQKVVCEIENSILNNPAKSIFPLSEDTLSAVENMLPQLTPIDFGVRYAEGLTLGLFGAAFSLVYFGLPVAFADVTPSSGTGFSNNDSTVHFVPPSITNTGIRAPPIVTDGLNTSLTNTSAANLTNISTAPPSTNLSSLSNRWGIPLGANNITTTAVTAIDTNVISQIVSTNEAAGFLRNYRDRLIARVTAIADTQQTLFEIMRQQVALTDKEAVLRNNLAATNTTSITNIAMQIAEITNQLANLAGKRTNYEAALYRLENNYNNLAEEFIRRFIQPNIGPYAQAKVREENAKADELRKKMDEVFDTVFPQGMQQFVTNQLNAAEARFAQNQTLYNETSLAIWQNIERDILNARDEVRATRANLESQAMVRAQEELNTRRSLPSILRQTTVILPTWIKEIIEENWWSRHYEPVKLVIEYLNDFPENILDLEKALQRKETEVLKQYLVRKQQQLLKVELTCAAEGNNRNQDIPLQRLSAFARGERQELEGLLHSLTAESMAAVTIEQIKAFIFNRSYGEDSRMYLAVKHAEANRASFWQSMAKANRDIAIALKNPREENFMDYASLYVSFRTEFANTFGPVFKLGSKNNPVNVSGILGGPAYLLSDLANLGYGFSQNAIRGTVSHIFAIPAFYDDLFTLYQLPASSKLKYNTGGLIIQINDIESKRCGFEILGIGNLPGFHLIGVNAYVVDVSVGEKTGVGLNLFELIEAKAKIDVRYRFRGALPNLDVKFSLAGNKLVLFKTGYGWFVYLPVVDANNQAIRYNEAIDYFNVDNSGECLSKFLNNVMKLFKGKKWPSEQFVVYLPSLVQLETLRQARLNTNPSIRYAKEVRWVTATDSCGVYRYGIEYLHKVNLEVLKTAQLRLEMLRQEATKINDAVTAQLITQQIEFLEANLNNPVYEQEMLSKVRSIQAALSQATDKKTAERLRKQLVDFAMLSPWHKLSEAPMYFPKEFKHILGFEDQTILELMGQWPFNTTYDTFEWISGMVDLSRLATIAKGLETGLGARIDLVRGETESIIRPEDFRTQTRAVVPDQMFNAYLRPLDTRLIPVPTKKLKDISIPDFQFTNFPTQTNSLITTIASVVPSSAKIQLTSPRMAWIRKLMSEGKIGRQIITLVNIGIGAESYVPELSAEDITTLTNGTVFRYTEFFRNLDQTLASENEERILDSDRKITLNSLYTAHSSYSIKVNGKWQKFAFVNQEAMDVPYVIIWTFRDDSYSCVFLTYEQFVKLGLNDPKKTTLKILGPQDDEIVVNFGPGYLPTVLGEGTTTIWHPDFVAQDKDGKPIPGVVEYANYIVGTRKKLVAGEEYENNGHPNRLTNDVVVVISDDSPEFPQTPYTYKGKKFV
ncbi:MAG: hypothetical protein NC923_02795, partial [Candidatus Omnitrophica bacterium]|nr:hypothetical protein [Candidatus Omnitrophota bacterium]